MNWLSKLLYYLLWPWVMCTHPVLRRYWLYQLRRWLSIRDTKTQLTLAAGLALVFVALIGHPLVLQQNQPIQALPKVSVPSELTVPSDNQTQKDQLPVAAAKTLTSEERWMRLLTETGIPEETWQMIHQDVKESLEQAGTLSADKT